MSRIGLAVPHSFCITSTAFREHLEVNNLISSIESATDKLNPASAEDSKSVLSEIRQVIIDAPLAEELRKQIESHYYKLGADRIAVRSSATAEDLPGHSFAGQYETYLGVADIAGCIDAIKKCWASLWSQRAYDYRQKNGFDHLRVNMAVIVQEMVQADAAGVIFTADPVTGYSSRMIIEACPGLADALVSGKVVPERFVIDKKKGRIVFKNLTCEPCITDSVVKKLTKIAKKAENYFGCPQDMEWAIQDNKIFLLQTRDITTKPKQKSWEDRQVWSNLNTGEVAPDVMTPITWSILQKFVDKMFGPLLSLISIKIGDHPIFGLVAGRVYYNLNMSIAFAKHFPGLMTPRADSLFGGEHGKIWDLVMRNTPDENLPDLHFSFFKTILKSPVSLIRILSFTHKRAQRLIDNTRIQSEYLNSLNLALISDEDLGKNFVAKISDEADFSDLMFVARGFTAFVMLDIVFKKWFGEDGQNLANSLFAGVSNIDIAEAGLSLWQLAEKAKGFSEVQEIILSEGNWQSKRGKIAEIQGGDEFLKSWDDFMTRHGHHCRGEIELFNPRWHERSDYILDIIRRYISSMEKAKPLQNYNKIAEQRKQLTLQCQQKLKNPLRRWIFKYLLGIAQKGFVIRENWKSETVRYMTALRKMLLELGKKLEEKDVLKNRNDIFFLRFEEVEPVVQGKAEFDVHQVIAIRREEYEKNKSVTPPAVVIGRFDPDKYVPETIDEDVSVLNGLAVSPGVVTGKARVILRADTDEHILAGEILVAPFTDPGWTPYFVPAAGIVMDQGGLLSHGSIIAREYGIPAVVNVGPATKIIKTGQTLQVDANHGVVRIIR